MREFNEEGENTDVLIWSKVRPEKPPHCHPVQAQSQDDSAGHVMFGFPPLREAYPTQTGDFHSQSSANPTEA